MNELIQPVIQEDLLLLLYNRKCIEMLCMVFVGFLKLLETVPVCTDRLMELPEKAGTISE